MPASATIDHKPAPAKHANALASRAPAKPAPAPKTAVHAEPVRAPALPPFARPPTPGAKPAEAVHPEKPGPAHAVPPAPALHPHAEAHPEAAAAPKRAHAPEAHPVAPAGAKPHPHAEAHPPSAAPLKPTHAPEAHPIAPPGAKPVVPKAAHPHTDPAPAAKKPASPALQAVAAKVLPPTAKALAHPMPSSPPRTPSVAPPAPASRLAPSPKPAPKLSPLGPPKTPGAGGGHPLPAHVQDALQTSLLVDLSSVRLHASTAAQRKAQSLKARAFTFGNDIFLGHGEHPTDLTLITHEVAHVIQQQSVVHAQAWSPSGGDRFEIEANQAATAVQRGERFEVRERVDRPRVQRLGISDALDYFADKAYNIPGYRMFTVVLGVNPINMEHVERSPANILRAVVEFIPGGNLITKALDKYGVFDKVGNWVQEQIDSLAITGGAIRKAVMDFLDSLSWRDIFHLGDVWDRAKRIFSEPIDRIKNFVVGLLEGIWKFVREAILKPIASLAEGTSGWPLLTAVLGSNPITGEKVERTPETLIGGFMKLIHEDEIWENIQKSGAISRAWAWFQSVLNGLMVFVNQIPELFKTALKTLEWSDILDLPGGFMKVAGVFGKFLGNFISWAGDKIWKLLEIIFDVVAPSVMPYLRKVGAAFRKILKDPIAFIMHLVDAAKLGLDNFAHNFVDHLKKALIDWLTGSLPGVYIPTAFTLIEFGKFALSVLGISWAQIRAKIVKALGPNGETIMKALETTFDVVVALIKGGPAAAWEVIKEKLTNLKDMVIDGIVGFVTDTIIKKAIPKLVSMFIPGAGFISAIVSIYDTIMVFVQKLAKIAAVVKGFVDGIVNIANGQIEGAAKKVETSLEGVLSLVISFLAGFLGLGNIASKVMAVIEKVRATVDKALDTAINFIIGKAKALFASLFGGKGKPDERSEEQKKADLESALKDAETLSKKPGISEGEVKTGLEPIKKKYKMVSLTLVVDKVDESETETVHFEGEINPKATSGKSTLTSDANKKITELDLVRPSSFRSKVSKALNPRGRDLVAAGLDQRHIVSSEDMIQHYKSNLEGQTFAAAKKKLDPKLKDKVDPLTAKVILVRVKGLYKDFYNDLSNLFLGDSSENRSIGQAIDEGKKGMGQVRLDEHVAKIEKKYAIGDLAITGYTWPEDR
jgi:hypothetical protein